MIYCEECRCSKQLLFAPHYTNYTCEVCGKRTALHYNPKIKKEDLQLQQEDNKMHPDKDVVICDTCLEGKGIKYDTPDGKGKYNRSCGRTAPLPCKVCGNHYQGGMGWLIPKSKLPEFFPPQPEKKEEPKVFLVRMKENYGDHKIGEILEAKEYHDANHDEAHLLIDIRWPGETNWNESCYKRRVELLIENEKSQKQEEKVNEQPNDTVKFEVTFSGPSYQEAERVLKGLRNLVEFLDLDLDVDYIQVVDRIEEEKEPEPQKSFLIRNNGRTVTVVRQHDKYPSEDELLNQSGVIVGNMIQFDQPSRNDLENLCTGPVTLTVSETKDGPDLFYEVQLYNGKRGWFHEEELDYLS